MGRELYVSPYKFMIIIYIRVDGENHSVTVVDDVVKVFYKFTKWIVLTEDF